MRIPIALLAAALVFAQTPQGPYVPSQAELDRIGARLAEVRSKPGAGIYAKAAEWILRFPEEFYTKDYFTNTLAVLDMATQPETSKSRLLRSYQSKIDGSLQPYIVNVPEDYVPGKPSRLDVVLHGRAATMNEVSFIASTRKPLAVRHLTLEVYGRTNNAYRWAGETDVFEALAAVRKDYKIDPDRIVLRGFSMGGAGTWHIGLHYPGKWAAIEAGAGFTETINYAKLKDIPDYVRPLLHIYDAVDYAINAVDVPTVGYGGEIDPQLKASQNIVDQLSAERIDPRGIRALWLVGPRTAHRFHPDSKKASDEFIDSNLPRRAPERIRFVTYTTRYNEVGPIRVEGLEKHFDRAEVDANGTTITTRNVSRLAFNDVRKLTIDGQAVAGAEFRKINGKWRKADKSSALRKRHGLQGPIDDAFMDAFVTVGAPTEFANVWAKYLRAELPSKTADAVTPEDIGSKSLVLFGDPQSNPLIAKINSKLPVRWDGDWIVVGDQRFAAAAHTLKMIYPNPLNPSRYVVLNSGHTFNEAAFKGTNALLYPRLPDYAVVEKTSGTVVLAGFFDENWKLKIARLGD